MKEHGLKIFIINHIMNGPTLLVAKLYKIFPGDRRKRGNRNCC